MSEKLSQVGRLAMRVEGDFWNAYYAQPGTMQGALHLGSIHMAAVADNDERKWSFIKIMRDIVSDYIFEATGIRPVWPDPPQAAPEHERSGHA